MARTLPLIEFNKQNRAEVNRKITCETVGEMCDGSMVWMETDRDAYADDQYQCILLNDRYYFIHM